MANVLKDYIERVERHINKYDDAVERGQKLEEDPDVDMEATKERLEEIQRKLQKMVDQL